MSAFSFPHYEEQLLLDSATAPGGVIVYYADGDEEIIHANQYLIHLLECSDVQDFLELTRGSFKHFVYADDLNATEDSIWSQVRERAGMDHVYYRVRTRRGRLLTLADYGKLVRHDRERPYFMAFVSPVTPKAAVDWLTGLPSMARFHELSRMGALALRNRGSKPTAVALDVMGMKSYNTRYGRERGDHLLRVLADVLRTRFGNEACSRFAEDHFYAFASEEGIEEKVQAVFDDFRKSGYARVPLRAGIYVCDEGDDIVAVGFDRAKISCDQDRKTWESHLAWFTDEMKQEARLRIHVLESIEKAVELGWIQPHYQAIVRSATGRVCDEEALARWIDPEFGALLPFQFVPALEEAGLLYKLDLCIVDRVVQDFLVKRKHGLSMVPVSVNFSLRDLQQVNLTQELSQRLDAAALPRRLLRVELTESVASTDPEFLNKQIDALHRAGFEVWMDDFGSGYSSLNALQEFDFDLIKLDMGFLRGNNPYKARQIVAGVVQVAGKLGVGTLTEGVETPEQAEFLSSVGCDMLQGYLYAKPVPLEEILARHAAGTCLPREPFDELGYWNAVSLLSLTDFAENDSSSLGWAPLSALPAGVLERRGNSWSLVRANDICIEQLQHSGLIPQEISHVGVVPVASGLIREFEDVETKAIASHAWESVFGLSEYSSGFQFYTRHVASCGGVDSFLLAGVPSMLGAGLGVYGDVPVAYAVFRALFDETGTEVVDTEYVYANPIYCEWLATDQNALVGKSFLSVNKNGSSEWFPYCYHAVVDGESAHGIIFSPEIGHWLSFNIAPSLVEGCCVYAFTMADAERQERQEMMQDRDTSELIVTLSEAFNSEADFTVAMNVLLASLSAYVHADRLYVFEREGKTYSNTFEWCAEGVEAQIGTLQNLDEEEFATWHRLIQRDSVVLISDVAEFRTIDPKMYWQLDRQGITRVLAIPLFGPNGLLGYIGADNYLLAEDVDAVRVLRTVSSFVSARIVNKRLFDQMQHVNTHDMLTGMLNRHGIDQAIDQLLEDNPEAPFSLALMDVDDFKTVNDMYGHAVGDDALRMLARAVEKAFPSSAVVGRNGGDEFLAFMMAPLSEMRACLEAFMAQDLVLEADDGFCRMSLSAGYVASPDQAANLRDAYTKADAALLSVKLSGKSGLRMYTPLMEIQYRAQAGFTPRDIAENVPGAIVVHEPGDGKILFANDEAIELFECDTHAEFMELTGGTYGGIVYPEDRERVRRELAAQSSIETMRVGEKDFVNYRIRTKRGNIRRVINNGRMVKLEGTGTLFYELIVIYDDFWHRLP